VLVVDDNADMADLLCEYLRSRGIEARSAYDAEGALEAAADLHPDLVLLDIELPDESGDVVARRLRKAGITRAILAMTGHTGSFAQRIVERGGFDGYVPKPCPLREIDALVGLGANGHEREAHSIDGHTVARSTSS
jgi:two-component system, OmpR family, response regulator